MATTTHYDNLRVARNAPPEVIKASYRALAQMYHPDRCSDPNAARNMQIINDAYTVLSDPAQRKAHDAAIGKEAGPTSYAGTAVLREQLATFQAANQRLAGINQALVNQYNGAATKHKAELVRIDKVHQAAISAVKLKAAADLKVKIKTQITRLFWTGVAMLLVGVNCGIFIMEHFK